MDTDSAAELLAYHYPQAISPKMRLLRISLIAIVLGISNQGNGDGSTGKEEKIRDCAELIQQLASSNEKPTTKRPPRSTVIFPVGYDMKAQQRIIEVRQTLCDHFEEALPFLVAALEDDRYSMTISWADGDAYYNYSVGSVCRNIIAANLEVYRSSIRFSGPQHWNRYNYGPISEEWWQSRKGRSLAELQVEAIDWAIEQLEAELQNEAREGGKAELTKLRTLRIEIAESGKPAKAKGMLRAVTKN